MKTYASNTIEKGIAFQDCLVAMLICLNPLAWIFSFLPGGMVTICLIIWFSFFFFCLFRRKSFITKPLIALSYILLLFFTKDFIIQSDNEYLSRYFMNFLALGILGYRFGFLNISVERVLRYVCAISLLILPYLATLDVSSFLSETGGVDYGAWMGISYGIVRFISALILYLLFYSQNRFQKTLIVFILVLYILFFMLYASRGAIVAILIMLIMAYLIKEENKKRRIFKVFIISIIIFIVAISLDSIIKSIYNQFQYYGIDSFFIEKMMSMVDGSEGFSNGRSDLNKVAILGIIERPLFGNGIAVFEKPNDGYVHNVFLQIFYELGLVPFIYYVTLFVLSLKVVLFSNYTKDIRIYIAFLFCSGCVELLFSSTFWTSQIFWIFLGVTTNVIIRKRVVAPLLYGS